MPRCLRCFHQSGSKSQWRLCGFSLLLFLAGCGGGSGGGGPAQQTPTVTAVTVSPASANVQPGKTQQFTASVSGSGDFSTAVTWSVSGTGDAPSGFGVISDSGLYTAPTTAPNPNTVTIEATSVADPTKTGSASAVIGSAAYHITGITVSPTSATVGTSGTKQFTATVQGTGTFSPAVNWAVNFTPGGDPIVGTISSTGLYTAPQTISGPWQIQATSTLDSLISGAAKVTITQGLPVIKQLTPSVANASDPIQVVGENLSAPGATVTVFFPGPNGVLLPVPVWADNASPTLLQLVVPLSAISGQVYVQTQMQGGSPQNSNSVAFTRLPRVRIRAPQQDLSQGESTTFQSRILSGTGTESLTWTVDVGSVTSSGVYTAPASVLSDSFAVVTACITGTQSCDQERLGLHPFRIAPAAPVIPLGGNVQLQAIQGGGFVNPSWQLNGPGSLQQDGTYTASTQPADGGGIPITASYGGVQEQVSVAVTGGFNGLVNRVSDYVDLQQTTSLPPGTWAVDVGVVGNQLYVLATDQFDLPLNSQPYWVDVYDITDPAHPVWVDAFEPAARGHFLSCDGYTYEFTGLDFSMGPPFAGVIAIYDTSGGSPILLSKQISTTSSAFWTSQNGCIFTVVSDGSLQQVPVVVDLFNLENGGVVHTQYTPIPGLTGGNLDGVASDGKRMYVISSSTLGVYDLTVQPPALIGSVPFEHVGWTIGGLSIVGDLLFASQGSGAGKIQSQVYEITNPQPMFLQSLSAGKVLSSSGAQVLTGSYDAGTQLVNVSNPQQPTVTGTLLDFIDPRYTAALSGTHVYQSEEYGGLAVYDTSANGGLPQSYLTIPGSSNVGFGPAFGQASNSSTLYFAIPYPDFPGSPSGILSFNLGTQPASYLGSFSTGTSVAQSLALSSNDLYVGTLDSLRVLDVTDPSTPTQIGSVNLGIQSLAVSGNSLFAGTLAKGLVVFDVTQPSSPVQKASLNLPDLANQMIVSGSLLLVADVSGGLLVYDITTPFSPQLLSQVKPSMGVFDVAMDGTLALLAAWDAGLVIVDLTTPSQPHVVAQAGLGTDQPYSISPVLLNKAFTVAVLDKIAYIGVLNFDPSGFPNNGQASIFGFDYTTPSLPRLVHLDAHQNEFLNDGILTLRAVGTELIVSTADNSLTGGPLQELDASQPRNAMNFLYLPSSLALPPALGQLPAGSVQRRKLPNRLNANR